MKLSRMRSVLGLLLLASAGTVDATLQSAVIYDTAATCNAPSAPAIVTTTTAACTVAAATCTGSWPFTQTACPTTYSSDVLTAFYGTSTPYVSIALYTGDTTCAAASLTNQVAYLADGACHKAGTAAATTSFKAVVNKDGSAIVKTYTDAACTTGAAVVGNPTSAQATGGTCFAVSGNGVIATVSSTKTALTVTGTYETKDTGNCAGAANFPSDWTAVYSGATSCTATTTCAASSWPYVRTTCNTVATYDTQVATAFGSNPYVTVYSYATGASCASTDFTGVKTYMADGVCHKTGTAAATSYFRAVVNQDGSAVVKTYTDAACSAGAAVVVSPTAAQAGTCITGTSVASTAIAVISTAKTALTATGTYETKDTNNCGGAANFPSDWTAVFTGASTCTATTTCAALGWPYVRTTCITGTTYDAAVATAFGSNPYVTVYTYTAGQSCAAIDITGVKTYMADGVCHKTGTAAAMSYFKAVVNQDGSAVVKTYTDAACTAGATVVASPTAAQATASTCIAGIAGTSTVTTVVSTAKTAIALTITGTYDTKDTGNCAGAANFPADWTAVITGSTTCTAVGTCTAATAWPYTRVACNAVSSYDAQVATAFGSNPYVTVYSYAAGASCATTELTGVKTFVADGVCHKTGTAASTSYFRAVVNQDGSAVVKTYSDAACTVVAGVVASPTVAQATSATCLNGTVGVNTITTVVSAAKTTIALTATATYETKDTGNCAGATNFPSDWSAVTSGTTTCAAVATCTAATAWPYTRTSCNPLSTYDTTVATAFGSNPYVTVYSYAAGASCATTDFTGVKTYMADGACHKTGTAASTSYFKAVVNQDGSAVVKTYTDAACTAGAVVVASPTATQATTSLCINGVAGANTVLAVVSTAKTASALTATATFDSSTVCASTGVPAQWSLSPTLTTCTASTACTAVAPWQRTSCTSLSAYQTAVATAFSSTPYVIVESYAAGQQCSPTDLTGVVVYVADGKCHVTGTSTSIKALANSDGSVVVRTYTDSACTTGTFLVRANSTQLATNDCSGGPTGVKDMKVFASTAKTPGLLTTTATFDSSTVCASTGVPALWSIAPTTTTCTASTTCTAAAPFQRTSCTSLSTYKGAIAAAFPATPFVIVESYAAGQQCSQTDLTGVMTYMADGMCHVTGTSSSFKANVTMSGAVSVMMYSASAACDDTTAKTTLTATSSQTRGNSCANDANGLKDKLVYAMSPRYLSVVVKYDAAACAGPAQVTIANATTCNPASCVTAGQGSLTYDCIDDSYAYAASLYKATSYVVAEVYAANTNCSTLQGLVAYAADAKCHIALDQSSSFMVTLPTDGSAQISLYNGLNCTGASSSVVAVAAAQLTAHTCVGNAKYYGFAYAAPTAAPVATTATPTTTTPAATTATPATTTATPANQQSGNSSPSLFTSMSTMVAASLAWVMLFLVWDP